MERKLYGGVYCAALCVLAHFACQAQNLVPNPSFEEYTSCPDDISQMDRVLDWTVLSASPDYFNVCNTNNTVGVPSNALGYQAAASGVGYIGVITNGPMGLSYREAAQAELTTTLIPGQLVHLSMRVSPGGFASPMNECCSPTMASNNIGIHFSVDQLPESIVITNMAQLHMEQVLNDTAVWTLLTGTYVPDSAYRFIQIGNFFDDESSEIVLLDPNGDSDYAYAFVDDVCVSTQSGVCGISVHVPEIGDTPGPVVTTLFGQTLPLNMDVLPFGKYHLQLTNGLGETSWDGTLWGRAGYKEIPTGSLGNGAYILRIQNPQGLIHTARVFKVSP